MPPRYLLCPQCGSHRFLVCPSGGKPVFFYVDIDRRPLPTETSRADLTGLDLTQVCCCGCSWKGALHKLVRFFSG